MLPEFQCPHIQRSIFAIKEILVPVERLHGDRIHGHGIFQHRFPVLTQLQLSDTVDEPLPGILFRDRQSKHIQLVSQQLCQFRNFEIALIRSPDRAVIDIPAFSLTVVPGDLLEIIRKHIAHADLISSIPGICVRSNFFQRDRDLGKVWLEFDIVILIQLGKFLIDNVLRIDRHIDSRTGIDGIADGNRTVGRTSLLAIPLITHQARCTEDAIHLLLIAATPECQNGQ